MLSVSVNQLVYLIECRGFFASVKIICHVIYFAADLMLALKTNVVFLLRFVVTGECFGVLIARLAVCISKQKLNGKQNSFEPSGIYILITDEPSGENLIFFLLLFRFYLTALLLNFFPILDAFSITKTGAVIVKETAYSFL